MQLDMMKDEAVSIARTRLINIVITSFLALPIAILAYLKNELPLEITAGSTAQVLLFTFLCAWLSIVSFFWFKQRKYRITFLVFFCLSAGFGIWKTYDSLMVEDWIGADPALVIIVSDNISDPINIRAIENLELVIPVRWPSDKGPRNVYWKRSPFAGRLEKTFMGKRLISSAETIAIIEITEFDGSLRIRPIWPFINPYSELGITYRAASTGAVIVGEGERFDPSKYMYKMILGFYNFSLSSNLSLTWSTIHKGFQMISVRNGLDWKESSVGLWPNNTLSLPPILAADDKTVGPSLAYLLYLSSSRYEEFNLRHKSCNNFRRFIDFSSYMENGRPFLPESISDYELSCLAFDSTINERSLIDLLPKDVLDRLEHVILKNVLKDGIDEYTLTRIPKTFREKTLIVKSVHELCIARSLTQLGKFQCYSEVLRKIHTTSLGSGPLWELLVGNLESSATFLVLSSYSQGDPNMKVDIPKFYSKYQKVRSELDLEILTCGLTDFISALFLSSQQSQNSSSLLEIYETLYSNFQYILHVSGCVPDQEYALTKYLVDGADREFLLDQVKSIDRIFFENNTVDDFLRKLLTFYSALLEHEDQNNEAKSIKVILDNEVNLAKAYRDYFVKSFAPYLPVQLLKRVSTDDVFDPLIAFYARESYKPRIQMEPTQPNFDNILEPRLVLEFLDSISQQLVDYPMLQLINLFKLMISNAEALKEDDFSTTNFLLTTEDVDEELYILSAIIIAEDNRTTARESLDLLKELKVKHPTVESKLYYQHYLLIQYLRNNFRTEANEVFEKMKVYLTSDQLGFYGLAFDSLLGSKNVSICDVEGQELLPVYNHLRGRFFDSDLWGSIRNDKGNAHSQSFDYAVQKYVVQYGMKVSGQEKDLDSDIIGFYRDRCVQTNSYQQVELEHFEEILEKIDTALAYNYQNFELHKSRAAVLSIMGRHDQAIDAYVAALIIELLDTDKKIRRGNFLLLLGRNDEALEAFNEVSILNPTNSDATLGQANALSALGRSEAALKAYDEYLLINPRNADAHFNRCNLLRIQDRYNEALEACDASLTINPHNASAHNNRAGILQVLGRSDEALKAYDRALVVDPNRLNTHINRGNLLGRLGRFSEALEDFDFVLDIDANSVIAKHNRDKTVEHMKLKEQKPAPSNSLH